MITVNLVAKTSCWSQEEETRLFEGQAVNHITIDSLHDAFFAEVVRLFGFAKDYRAGSNMLSRATTIQTGLWTIDMPAELVGFPMIRLWVWVPKRL